VLLVLFLFDKLTYCPLCNVTIKIKIFQTTSFRFDPKAQRVGAWRKTFYRIIEGDELESQCNKSPQLCVEKWKTLYPEQSTQCEGLFVMTCNQPRPKVELFIMKTNMKHEKNIITVVAAVSMYALLLLFLCVCVWVCECRGHLKRKSNIPSCTGSMFFSFRMTGIIQFGHRIYSNLYMLYMLLTFASTTASFMCVYVCVCIAVILHKDKTYKLYSDHAEK